MMIYLAKEGTGKGCIENTIHHLDPFLLTRKNFGCSKIRGDGKRNKKGMAAVAVHPLDYRSDFSYFFRYSVGSIPVSCLNSLLKYLISLYPTFSAMTPIFKFVWTR